MVERGNKELGDGLRALLLDRAEDDWDLLLPQIMRSIRATPHSTTQETSNYLMFGRELKLPGSLSHPELTETKGRLEHAAEIQHRLEDAYELLRDSQKQIRSTDEHNPPLYQTGDLVWLKNKRFKKGSTPKLQPKFVGPYTIMQAMENHTYLLSLNGKTCVENECRLKLYSPTTAAWGKTHHQAENTRQPPRHGGNRRRPTNEVENSEENPPLPPSILSPPPILPPTEEDSAEPTEPLENATPEGTTPILEDSESEETERENARPLRQRKQRQYPGFIVYSIDVTSDSLPIKAGPSSHLPQMPLSSCTVNMPTHPSFEKQVEDLREQLAMSDTDKEEATPRTPQKTPAPVLKINTQERSSNAKLLFSSTRHKFVHTNSEYVFEHIVSRLKLETHCFLCSVNSPASRSLKEEHAWDHLTIRVCKCGVIFHDYRSANEHSRRVHKGEKFTITLVDKLFYGEAKEHLTILQLHPSYPGVQLDYDKVLADKSLVEVKPKPKQALLISPLPKPKLPRLSTSKKRKTKPSQAAEKENISPPVKKTPARTVIRPPTPTESTPYSVIQDSPLRDTKSLSPVTPVSPPSVEPRPTVFSRLAASFSKPLIPITCYHTRRPQPTVTIPTSPIASPDRSAAYSPEVILPSPTLRPAHSTMTASPAEMSTSELCIRLSTENERLQQSQQVITQLLSELRRRQL